MSTTFGWIALLSGITLLALPSIMSTCDALLGKSVEELSE